MTATVSVLIGLAVLGLAWSIGSAVLRLLAWFLLVAMALSLVAGIAVPPGVLVATVMCWTAAHAIYRLRHGCWRSQLLDATLARRRRLES